MRHPKLVLAGAVAALLLLGILGAGVERRLEPTSLTIPGTDSARGEELLREHFGESASFAILLEGPAPQLDRQGPRLIRTLRGEPGVTTLSPWDRGVGLQGLRPDPGTAVVLVDFHVPVAAAIETIVPHLDDLLASEVSAPVDARAAGFASVARAIQDESVEVTRRGELIVTPILLLILLLVFRSPVAAAIPLVFGVTTVVAARGLMSIAAGFLDISPFALSVASMIGLALGVDYALLIVSRFREELEAGADPAEAASVTRRTAGRTTIFAGSTLFASILTATFLVPGMLLFSLCVTVVIVVALAVVGPWLVGPAILVLVGHGVDRWRIGRSSPVRTRWIAISRGALRRPQLAAVLVSLLLLLFAVPAATLATGPLTVEQLSADDPTRLDVEAIEAAVGGGWIAPFVVVLASGEGPVTTPRELGALSRWQARLAEEGNVEAVIGPGPLIRRVTPIRREGRSFVSRSPGRGAAGMAADLGRAGRGLARLRRGLGLASAGARALALGSGRAREGSLLLARGLSLAAGAGAGTKRALRRFSRGSHLLANGQRSALLGASVIAFGTDELRTAVGRRALPESERLERALAGAQAGLPAAEVAATATVQKLEAAWAELAGMTVGTSDPRYPALAAAIREALTAASGADPASAAPYASGYKGLPRTLADLGALLRGSAGDAGALSARLSGIEGEIALLRGVATRLHDGIERLEGGSERLAGGSDRIVSGGARLSAGLGRLAAGAERLAAGLARLHRGNEELARGISTGFHRLRPLVVTAHRADVRVSSGRSRLQRVSPGFFDSGYFVLSGLDGAPPGPRAIAAQAVDLDNGGRAARVLVVSSHSLHDPDSPALYDRIRSRADDLGERTKAQVAVTGGIAQTTDYDRANGDRLPSLVVAITLITFLAMVVILRALPLAAIAIVLNLLTVAAAFGVLKLLTLVPEGLPFGGTDHVDPVGAAGIFGVVFGLSIDYAVFLLSRMRESWERDGDHDAAVTHGLERTASVITGAATIMVVVFSVFATTSVDTIAQFGVGLTVAVALDATAIRLVLLPVLMRLIGPGVWWLPPWLARRLRGLDLHGDRAAA